MGDAVALAEHITFRVGHVDDLDVIAANNIAMAKVGRVPDGCQAG